MAEQGNRTSLSSEYSDERAARPTPGTDEYFNEKIYCTCKKCQNRKLKKRRIIRSHRLKYGVYIEEDVPTGTLNSSMGDALKLLNGLMEMVKNGQGQAIATIVQEAISKVVPDPITPIPTYNTTETDVSRGCVMPSSSRLDTPSTSSAIPDSTQFTSNMDAPSIHIETNMHVPVISQSINNPLNMGSVGVLPPTPEQATLRSLIESQSRTLRLLPDTLDNAECRKEMLKQIELWERALLGRVDLTSDEQDINKEVTHVPIEASTSTPKTKTISLVVTKGTEEATILLSSEGDVLKDEKGMKLFHFIYHRAKQLFGNTIEKDWRKQTAAKKEELFKDVITTFGNPGFSKESILDIARKYIHSKRDNLRSKLTTDLRYPRPAWITDSKTWEELIKDAEFKRKAQSDPNYRIIARKSSKRCLRDTTKATQARVSSIGSHKLGSGGYRSICGDLVHQFQKEASKENLKFALLHGSQGLRQHMLDQGEKLVTEEPKKSTLVGCENENEIEEPIRENENEIEEPIRENENEIEEHAELVFAQNDSTSILEPQQETNLEFQQAENENNDDGVLCANQTIPTIRIVPRRKRTLRKRIDEIQS